MLLDRNIYIQLLTAGLGLVCLTPAARASFIMSPMPASVSSGPSYQPATPAGKPGPGQPPVYASDLTQGFLQPDLSTPVPLSLPVGSDHGAEDGGGKTILPEPATIAILGVGLLSLAFLRRAGA